MGGPMFSALTLMHLDSLAGIGRGEFWVSRYAEKTVKRVIFLYGRRIFSIRAIRLQKVFISFSHFLLILPPMGLAADHHMATRRAM